MENGEWNGKMFMLGNRYFSAKFMSLSKARRVTRRISLIISVNFRVFVYTSMMR